MLVLSSFPMQMFQKKATSFPQLLRRTVRNSQTYSKYMVPSARLTYPEGCSHSPLRTDLVIDDQRGDCGRGTPRQKIYVQYG